MYEDTYFLDPDCRSQPNSLPPGLGTAFQFLPDPTLTYDLESSDDPLLYDLDDDRGEKINLAQQYPEVVASLMKQASLIRKELGDVNVTGTDQRPHGLINPNEKQ
ncbi:MAG: hypothetical protein ACN4GF_07930 [Lentimonas sp.]